jgi:hypothetical protein
LTPDYLASDFCVHEMDSAIAKYHATNGEHAVPLVRETVNLPATIETLLRVDLTDDRNHDSWNLLMRACEGALSVPAPIWLESRDRVLRHLRDGQSVNLITAVTHRCAHALPLRFYIIDLLPKSIDAKPAVVHGVRNLTWLPRKKPVPSGQRRAKPHLCRRACCCRDDTREVHLLPSDIGRLLSACRELGYDDLAVPIRFALQTSTDRGVLLKGRNRTEIFEGCSYAT